MDIIWISVFHNKDNKWCVSVIIICDFKFTEANTSYGFKNVNEIDYICWFRYLLTNKKHDIY